MGQLELPFGAPPGGRWAAARRAARPTLRVLGRVAQFLLRWALRIGLPLLGAAAVLQLFPYHATVQEVPFTVQGSLLLRPGLSADTTLGNWEFPEVDGLPFGVHITPQNVDVIAVARAANQDTDAYVQNLKDDFTAQLPRIALWLAGEFVLGLAIGLAAAAGINMALRYARGLPRRPRELRRRGLQLGAAVLVTAAVAGYGVLTYNPDWVRTSRLTGTLAAAQLFPSQLRAYYTQQSKAFDVLGSVIGIQAALQAQIERDQTPPTALQIMFISDMHLAADYPLVGQYAQNYGVDLIVNTGDESEFGLREELTPSYLDAMKAVTAKTPMIWIAGNHDSPDIVEVMRGVPGVTVLGTKTAEDDGYVVTAGVVQAYGLTIAGLSDPRVYGGPGAYGADDPKVTDPLERAAVDRAIGVGDSSASASSSSASSSASSSSASSSSSAAPADGSPDPSASDRKVDIFATHEPVAADALRAALPHRIRQTNSGHTHKQNATKDLQHGSEIDLVEGSTGAGGLDNIVRGVNRPPIEFSIESVGADCQFTRVIRFQINSQQSGDPTAPSGTPQAYGDDVTASTVYFRPQDIAPNRTCGIGLGIGKEHPW